MKKSRILLVILFNTVLVSIAQTSRIDRLNEKLLKGEYKKLGAELSELPTPSNKEDLVKVASIQMVYSSLFGEVEKVNKSEEVILQYVNSFDNSNALDKLNAATFVSDNLLKIKRIDLNKTYLEKHIPLFNVADAQLSLASLTFLNSLIENYTIGGYNSEAKNYIDNNQKSFELLESEKTDKAKIAVYNKYLFVRGLYLYQFGDYAEADKYFVLFQKHYKSNKGLNFENYYKALYYKALSMEELGQTYEGIKLLRKSFYFKGNKKSITKLEIRAKIAEFYANTSKDLNFLRNKSKYEFATRKFMDENPLRYRAKLLEIKRLQFYNSYEKAYKIQKNDSKTLLLDYAKINPWMLDVIYTQYVSNIKTHRYSEAKDTLNQYVKLYTKLYGEKSPEVSQVKMKVAEFLLLYSNDIEAANSIIVNDYDNVIVKNYSALHTNNCDNLITKSIYLKETEQFSNQVVILEKAKVIASLDSSFEEKIKVNENLSEAYLLNGDYQKAEDLVIKSISLINKETKNSKLHSSVAYLDLAKFYLSVGKLQEAKKSVNTAKKHASKSKFDTDLVMGNSLDEQASLLMEFSKFNKAEELLLDNVEYKTKLFGPESKTLIDSYNSLAKLNLIEGKYSEAEEYINKSLLISKKVYGDKSLKFSNVLAIQKDLFISLGDLKKADKNAQEIYAIRKVKLGDDHVKTADALESVGATNFMYAHNAEKSLNDIDKALAVYNAKKLNQHPLYSDMLTNKAYILLTQNKLDESDKLLLQSVEILKSTVGPKSIKLAETYLVLASLAKEKADYKKAEKFINNAKDIYSSNFSTEHPSYVKCLSALGKIQFIEGKVDQSISTLEKTTKLYLKFTDTYFKYLNSKEKLKFWTSIKEDFEFLNFIVISNEKVNYYPNIYENTLKTKGLLLANSQKVVKIINASKDEALKQKYNEWVLKKEDLRNLITQGGDGESYTNELIRIENDVNILEKDLSKMSSEFKNVINTNEPKFEEVKKELKSDEVVFEMVRYRKFDKDFTDSVVYAGIIFDKTSKKPKIVKLKNGEKLESKFLSYYRNSLKNRFDDRYSYGKFWQAFDNELKNYKTVYFSPEGVYNMINVNTFKDMEGKYMIDKYLVVNLCNSKDLVINNSQKENSGTVTKTAMVVAGPDFYEGADGYSIAKLTGAEKEGKLVTEILKKDGYKVDYFTGLDATKEVLKKANSPTVMHIATHGSFQENDDKESSSNNLLVSEFLQDPLFKSNLMFAKTGDYLENKKAFINSPMLSAHEVMDMSLDGTKTVVLSACETGLGTYTVGEGVFGLKRAFLVAGAQSIFTSLFKVADVVTLELMDKYYNYYAVNKYTKEKAFYEAQRDIMKKYPDPLYWGSFILTGNK